MALSALLIAAVLASPHDQVGFGSAGGGLAGAAVADAPGASATFYNPALAAERRDVEVMLGYRSASLQMRLNDDDQGIEAARALSLGIIAPLSLGDWGRVGIAIAVTVPDRRLYQVRILPPDRPRFLMYDSRLQRLAADAALSYALELGEVTFGLAAGASVLAGASGGGTTFYLREGGDFTLADAAVQNELPLLSTPSGAIFVRWRGFSIGATYRGQQRFDLSLGTLADISVGPLAGDIYSGASAAAFYTPMKLAFGASWSGEWLSVHTALEVHRWSVAPPMTPVAVIDVSFEGLPVDLPQGRPARQDLRDVVLPRLGVESNWMLGTLQLAARAGVFYAPTPVEEGSLSVFLDSSSVGAAVGLGVTTQRLFGPFYEPLSIDAHVMGQRLQSRHYSSGGSTDVRPDMTIDGYVVSGGLSVTLRF